MQKKMTLELAWIVTIVISLLLMMIDIHLLMNLITNLVPYHYSFVFYVGCTFSASHTAAKFQQFVEVSL